MPYEEGGWERPAAGDPRAASQGPGYQGPGYQRPGYQRPGYQPQPGYQRPGYQPGYQPQPQQPGYQRQPQQPGQPRYQQQAGYQPPGYQQSAPPPVSRWGGATGNERLTAMTGAVLLILLLVEGVTILRLGRLLTLHFFLGMLLIGPVTLKAGSTIYRFVRYYTGHAEYRRKGPPAPLLRLLGPFVVLLTACVLGTGVMLAVTGPSGRSNWLFLHKASFVLWFCVMAVHVLWYAPRLPRLLSREMRGIGEPEDSGYARGGRYSSRTVAVLGGRGVRLTLLLASLLLGLVIALLTVHLAGAWHSGGLPFPGHK